MKRWLRKWLPSHNSMQHHKNTRWIAEWLNRYPTLWTLNRKTVARGVAAGLLVAFIPIPAQIIFSSVLALLFRANLPVAVLSTLISNPFTFVPLNLLIYHLGILITGSNGAGPPPSMDGLEFHWQSITLIWQEMWTWFTSLGKSYLTGLLVFSVSASITGFFLVHILWRISIWLQLKNQRKKRNRHGKN